VVKVLNSYHVCAKSYKISNLEIMVPFCQTGSHIDIINLIVHSVLHKYRLSQKIVQFSLKAPNLVQQLLDSCHFIQDKYTKKIGIFN